MGHNVNFDINFLYDRFLSYDKILDNNFIDTLRYARRLLTQLEHHRLTDLATYYKIDGSGAHRSLRDCEITLECYTKLKRDALNKYGSLDNFAKTWEKNRNKKKNRTYLKASEIVSNSTEFDETHPLFNKTCVFTGALQVSRRDAMQKVVDLGGKVGNSVTQKTNYLILGNYDYVKSVKDGKSNKYKKAEELYTAGYDIEIIPEIVFWDLVNS